MDSDKINRREFILSLIKAGVASAILLEGGKASALLNKLAQLEVGLPTQTNPKISKPTSVLVVAEKGNPAELTKAAINGIGGIKKYVKKGDIVVLKPNIAFDRRPEQAATTNPEVVKTLTELCYSAGAKEVRVFDRTVNHPKLTYQNSGIEEAVKSAGGKVYFVDENKFKEVEIPNGIALKRWSFYVDMLDADVYINVPIAKHHSLTGATLGLKNVMGVIGGNRGLIHISIHQKLADLNTVRKPTLTVLDAYRILIRHGPSGGNLADVKQTEQIIVSEDPVAIDAYGATLLGYDPMELGFLKCAYQLGLGELDLKKVEIKRISLSKS